MAYKKIVNKDAAGNTVAAVTTADLVQMADGGNAEVQITDALTRVGAVEGKVAELEKGAPCDFCVAETEPEQLAPEMPNVKGSKEFALAWYPWLVDMTDNKGKAVEKAYILKKNNWFRRASTGEFAPAVCVSAEDWALCDVALYLDAAHTQKYCEAGAFDAVAFYNEHGVTQKLYNADGTEVKHIRRPWETTNKDLGQFVGRREGINLCDNQIGRSGKKLKGVFGSQNNYDGAQFGQFHLDPTGISPSPICTIGNKSRSFFYLMKGETNCANFKGTSGSDLFVINNRTFPRVLDAQQVTSMRWARANNADINAPYPFAEGGYLALNAFLTCMEIGYGTKFLHDADMFSSGVSSNDSCSNEETWKANGGVRVKKEADSAWSYHTWSSSSMIHKSDGKADNLSYALNYYAPKMAVNEAQIAASYAAETGVPEGQDFEMYGATYWWKAVPGAKSLTDGEMNCRIYKKVIGKVAAYDSTKAPATFDVECICRTGLMQGVNASGDVFAYWGGGYEQIGKTHKDGGGYGFEIDLYLQPDQKKWLKLEQHTIDIKEKFGCEDRYIHVAHTTNQGDGYTLVRHANAAFPEKKGGSIRTGECFYSWNYNYWCNQANKCCRIAARFRGNAHYGHCAPRSLYAHYYVVSTHYIYAGSAQVLLGAAECNGRAQP